VPRRRPPADSFRRSGDFVPRRRPPAASFRLGLAPALALLALGCAPPPDDLDPGAETRDLIHFLRRLRAPDHLPELEASHTAMESTWDRTGGNRDWDDFKRIEGEHNILLDVDGPGCVHRLYTGLTGAAVEGTRIQLFLDGAHAPTLDLPVTELFSEDGQSPIPYPLVQNRTLPGTHLPIPFERHLKIQLVNPERRNWGVYWQVTYTRYSQGTPVRSLRLPFSAEEREELDRVASRWLDAAAWPPVEPAAWSLVRRLTLRPGQTRRVELGGCGVIRELRVATAPATPKVLRGVRLKMFWDGSDTSSVDVPLGYFFGHGDAGHVEGARFSSLVLGVTGREAYTRLPMPHRDGAVLSFENRAGETVQLEVKLDVDRCAGRLPASWGRLHATWRSGLAATDASPTVGPLSVPAHPVLDREGRGKYVGTLLHIDWPFWLPWWGEGDWLFWTDEQAWPPSYHGTGSEEYFNCGWTLFERKAMSGYITGRPGPVGFYSFHLNDAFQFQRSIRVLQETVGSLYGDAIIRLLHPSWGTTAFWYADRALPAGSLPE
jgi:hypothetical protein